MGKKGRIFKTRWFTRFADKEGITDGELREVILIKRNCGFTREQQKQILPCRIVNSPTLLKRANTLK